MQPCEIGLSVPLKTRVRQKVDDLCRGSVTTTGEPGRNIEKSMSYRWFSTIEL
jgi:hypothetical protein